MYKEKTQHFAKTLFHHKYHNLSCPNSHWNVCLQMLRAITNVNNNWKKCPIMVILKWIQDRRAMKQLTTFRTKNNKSTPIQLEGSYVLCVKRDSNINVTFRFTWECTQMINNSNVNIAKRNSWPKEILKSMNEVTFRRKCTNATSVELGMPNPTKVKITLKCAVELLFQSNKPLSQTNIHNCDIIIIYKIK